MGLGKNSAFSLIELIMIIVLIAIVAVVVSVTTGSNKLTGVANKLMFDLRYAQQLAISRQVSCGISIDPAEDVYFVYIGDVSVKAADPHTGDELEVDYDSGSEYEGINLVNTNFGGRLSFDALGAPYDSDDVLLSSEGTISLEQDSQTKSVTIEPSTGVIKVL